MIILNNPGGYWRRLAQRSPTLGQRIRLLLAQTMDTELSSRGFNDFYEWYTRPLQWVLDPVDPVNYANPDRFESTSILYQEVAGDEVSGNGLNNNQPFEPNDVIAEALKLPRLSKTTRVPNGGTVRGRVVFRKAFAKHDMLSSLTLVEGSDSEKGFMEMTHEIWSLLTSEGSQIEIPDQEVILP